MNYWLIKSEPFVYSFADLEKEGKSMWEGVRNYQARNNLRAMKKGDLTLFYHSREGLEVVGIAKVVKENYPDPTAEKGDWSVVEFAPVRRLAHPVTLKRIKADPTLQDILLVRNGRISVMPLEPEAYQRILTLSENPS
ncbi:MAG: EVE domain-containing protein [Saprospiraceae bacterium]|nr:EVE domain-containing protein [Saprospiraceae bacterium]